MILFKQLTFVHCGGTTKKADYCEQRGFQDSKIICKVQETSKKDNSHRIVEECEILEGDVKLIRTTKSGKTACVSRV